MSFQKIAQILMLLAALVIGATAPIHNGQTMLALALLAIALLAGVLLIARMGRQPASAEVESAR